MTAFPDAAVALAAALTPDGQTPGWAEHVEAQAAIDELHALGWEITERTPLSELPSHAPSRGPRTSDEAAESIADMSTRHYHTWCAFTEIGPATDEELAAAYPGLAEKWGYTPQSPSSLRTRRAELVRAGHIEATTLLRPTRSGRNARVWQAK